jgi:hypothetical protein
MSRNPALAVVIEGGLVQTIIVEDWPTVIPLPRIVIVDYDIEGASDDEITRFFIGSDPAEAFCRGEAPQVYESISDALSPKVVLAALGDEVDGEVRDSPLAIARTLRESVVELDAQLSRSKREPSGEGYRRLYELTRRGLIDLLTAMGDPPTANP